MSTNTSKRKAANLAPVTAEAASMYAAGQTCAQIADKLGFSEAKVNVALRRMGVVIRTNIGRRRHPLPDDFDAIFNLHGRVLPVAEHYCVARLVVNRWLHELGIPKPTQSDAQRILVASRSPEKRKAQAQAAHAARRGTPVREESLRKLSATTEARGVMTPREAVWAAHLCAEGIDTVPQKAFGRFNVDLSVCSAKVAIEVQNGWHGVGRHKERDARKKAFVESQGWVLVPVHDRQIGGRAFAALVALIKSRTS